MQKNYETDCVSIITPVYNAARFLPAMIESVLAQDYKQWELILIDDGSSDNSLEVIASYDDKRIKTLRNTVNLGPAKTRNVGIEQAVGQFIAFLDSDDMWLPTKLSTQLQLMRSKACALSYTAHHKINESGEKLAFYPAIDELTYKQMLRANFMRFSSVIYDRKVLGTVYLPDIAKRQDYAICLEMLRKIPFACGVTESLLLYRVVPHSVSNSGKIKLIKYNWRVFRQCEKLPLWRCVLSLFFNIIYKIFLKK